MHRNRIKKFNFATKDSHPSTGSNALAIMFLFGTVGLATVDYAKGFDALNRGDYTTAFTTAFAEFYPLVEQGNANAQYNLAIMSGPNSGGRLSATTGFSSMLLMVKVRQCRNRLQKHQ
jgi:hypothetical protein